jgi:hypothetical protein
VQGNEDSGIDAVEHSESAYHELIPTDERTRRLLPVHYGTDQV